MNELEKQYSLRYNQVLLGMSKEIEKNLIELLFHFPRIDKISARAKSIIRFLAKAAKIENDELTYNDPLNQIQDQIGARIVTFYLDDVENVATYVQKYFKHIEKRNHIPDSEKEFGYFGKHFIFLIPKELKPDKFDSSLIPNFFELQIVTLFQHAWSEAEHDLAYKPQTDLDKEHIRKVAFTAAQAWGADMIFNDLQRELIH